MSELEKYSEMSWVLVVFRDNWADEMDLRGFRVFTVESWQAYQDGIPNRGFSIGFGTNEDI
jgi:hypothetical protein